MKNSKNSLPSNWPNHIKYINTNVYSKRLTETQFIELGLKDPENKTMIKETSQPVCKLVKIKVIVDKSHPAYGQFGLFTTRKLPPNYHIIDYLGYVHPDEESDPLSDYDLVLDRGNGGVAIDAQHYGTEARMINDYRGIQERPNVKFDVKRVNGILTIGIFTLDKSIDKGVELCINYGKGFWNNRKNS